MSLSVPVFGPNTPSDGTKDYELPYTEAKRLVLDGFAQFINRATAIRILKIAPAKFRDMSAKMGHRLIFNFAASPSAALKAIVESWRPEFKVTTAQYPDIPFVSPFPYQVEVSG